MKYIRDCVPVFLLLVFVTGSVLGQVSPEEHKKHHPKQAGKEAAGGGGMMGKGGGGMGGMMKSMGVPPPKELYPSLMSVDRLNDRERADLESKAHQRMKSGAGLLSEGLGELSQLAGGRDFRGMERALGRMKEGLAEFESGLATHRALVEGRRPADVALRWFKKEMNLSAVAQDHKDSGPMGLSWFHWSIMGILFAFAAATLGLSFLKMKRASALLKELTEAPSSPEPEEEKVAGTVGSRDLSWPEEMEVIDTFAETGAIRTFRFIDPEHRRRIFEFDAGQFMTVEVEIDGRKQRRSYTISSAPQHPYVELTIKREDKGLVSRFLHEHLGPGVRIKVRPPAGSFVFDEKAHDSVVLISGGVGATPMMSTLRWLLESNWPGSIFYVHSCRTVSDIVFRDELDYLAKRHPNLKLLVTLSGETDRKWKGLKGRISVDMLKEHIPDVSSRVFHICGPGPMMDAVVGMLEALSVPPQNVHRESFGGPAKKKEKSLTNAVQSSKKTDFRVAFSRSGKEARSTAEECVLDLAESLEIDIDSSCRTGVCGACKVRLLGGTVEMEVEDALDDDDRKDKVVLACQAQPRSDIEIDA